MQIDSKKERDTSIYKVSRSFCAVDGRGPFGGLGVCWGGRVVPGKAGGMEHPVPMDFGYRRVLRNNFVSMHFEC